MIKFDRTLMDNITKENGTKGQAHFERTDIRKAKNICLYNLSTELDSISSYEMAHLTNNIDRWIHNRNSNNTATYKRGEIIFVDLGAINFKYEPSYTHPAVVLKNAFNSLLIVPCSTKKFGRGYSDVIDAYVSDGFSKDTGIQVGALRWINKNRVISTTSRKVKPRILDEINNHILSYIPTYKRDKRKFESIDIENRELKDKNHALELKIKELEEQIEVMKTKEYESKQLNG